MKYDNIEFNKMKEGNIYNPYVKELVYRRIRTRYLVDKYNKTKSYQFKRREKMIRKLIKNIGSNPFFEPNIRLEYGDNIIAGDNFYMNFDCTILDVATVRIGNNVMFGSRVTLATPMHPLLADERMSKEYPDGFHDLEYAKPITIEDDVWVCSNVTIIGGVTIGKGSVIGAGAVVTKSVPENSLVMGVPAKVVRKITEEDRLNIWDKYIK